MTNTTKALLLPGDREVIRALLRDRDELAAAVKGRTVSCICGGEDGARLEFAMNNLCIIDPARLTDFSNGGCVRIYDTRGALDAAIDAARKGGA